MTAETETILSVILILIGLGIKQGVKKSEFLSISMSTLLVAVCLSLACLGTWASTRQGESAQQGPPFQVSGWTLGDLPSLQRAVGHGAVDEVNVDWFASEVNGSIAGSEVNPDLVAVARAAGLKVLATVTNWNNEKDDFDPDIGHAILASASMRTKHAKALRDMCLARGYDGIDLDWENLKGEDRDRFSAFVEELAGLLHAEGKLLSIAIHAKTSEPGTLDGAIAEDWSRLGAAVDEFKVMTYEYSGSWSEPGPVAPPDWMDGVMAFAETLVPAAKIRMGIPFYGYDWHGNTADGINWTDAQGLIAKYSPAVQRDPSGEATFAYTDESATAHIVFFQDRTALQAKLRVVSDKHPAIAGIAIWVLQDEDPAFWDDIVSLLRRPAPAVTTPATPSGPASGTTGTSYSYSTGGSTSSLGYTVEYQFDWKGDGSDLSSWGSATQSKTWTTAGTYSIRARARCTQDTSIVSSWSGSITVNIGQVPMVGSLENPSQGQNVSGITTIHGWALDGKKVRKVELFVDGTYAGDIPYGGTRNDVKAAYPQYPNADLSGFGMVVNYSLLTSGSHAVLVRLHNQDGQIKDLTATVTVVKFHGEYVTNASPSSYSMNNVTVTIGGVTKSYDITVQWSNGTQGFEINEGVLSGGSSLYLTDENDLNPGFFPSQIVSWSKSSEPLMSLPLIGALENPSNGQKFFGITTIHGWALDGKGITKVELYVDNQLVGDIPYGGIRMDVKNANPNYPNAENSGFGLVINYSLLSSGSHAILVRVHNQDGQIKDLTATVTVVKFHGEFVTGVSPSSWTLSNVDVTVGGVTKKYDITIQWANEAQEFEITNVIQK